MKIKIMFFIGVFALFYLNSCAPTLNNTNKTNIQKSYYPASSDTAKFQFLKGFSTSEEVVKSTKFTQSIVGKQENLFMVKPYGIAIEKNKIYVSDIGLKGLNIIDVKLKTFEQFRPVDKDLEFVLASFVDTNDDRYIMDTKTKMVLVYNSTGKYITKFSVSENIRPTDIFIKDNTIWIADYKNNRINIYSKETYKLIDYFPKNLTNEDEAYLYQPIDIFVNEQYIYVLDAGAFMVKIYSHEGEFIKSFGSYGKGYGQFVRPKSIVVDKEGNILVVDSAFQNVQMFNSSGQILMYFGEKRDNVSGLFVPTSIAIDYTNLEYFKEYIDPKYELKYLVYVVSQLGNEKVKIFGRIELK